MKTRTITLHKKDLLFDVDSITYSLSKTLEEGSVNIADAVATDQGLQYQHRTLERFMDAAVARLKTGISGYVESLGGEMEADDDKLSEADYRIDMRVVDEFKDQNLSAITDVMHRYVVNSAVFEWYSAVGNANAQHYAPEARGDMDMIKRLLSDYDIPQITSL